MKAIQELLNVPTKEEKREKDGTSTAAPIARRTKMNRRMFRFHVSKENKPFAASWRGINKKFSTILTTGNIWRGKANNKTIESEILKISASIPHNTSVITPGVVSWKKKYPNNPNTR